MNRGKKKFPEGVVFYYFRWEGHPFACVALADNGHGDYCRGVSICSPEDQFSRKEARRIAYGRLCKAFGTGLTSDLIAPENSGKAIQLKFHMRKLRETGIFHKTGYCVRLTKYEEELVAERKRKETA
jgi:hypothetical protein